ncbi:MAG TPA: NAD-dependent epimerase/dehydratase family protein [Actinomycetota bacterium]|nr:NAD-dependent epimerase/dehydratase family protein [Actinomycetota bacterium]
MKAFVTGATGFVGGHLAAKLIARGDEVVALVRSPHKAGELTRLGVDIVQGDLDSTETMTNAMRGCDAVFHVAAGYKVGVFEEGCDEMRRANIVGTENVLRAAVDADVGRIVYVSTLGYYGNTRGKVVDESFERSDKDWLTCYDETKFKAHEVAKRFVAQGAPVLIAQPGGIYGPGDTSDLSVLVDRVKKGWMKVNLMPSVGFNFVHVDDVVGGLLLIHDKGRVGQSYNLGGEITTLGELIAKVAQLAGRKSPRREVPIGLIKRSGGPWKYLAPLLGFPPNLRELIQASDGVTYWGSDDKARRELGYAPRTLDVGLPDVV